MDLDLGDTRRIVQACRAHGLTPPQTAYVLATAYWETARTMKPVREAYWLSEAWRKANLRYWPWYGRGYVQLTWEENYLRAGQRLGLDLTTDPDRVMEPSIASTILVRGMIEGWFTGRKLGEFVGGHGTDFRGARRVVNGTDRAAEIARLAEDYQKALAAEPPASEPQDPATRGRHLLALFWAGLMALIARARS